MLSVQLTINCIHKRRLNEARIKECQCLIAEICGSITNTVLYWSTANFPRTIRSLGSVYFVLACENDSDLVTQLAMCRFFTSMSRLAGFTVLSKSIQFVASSVCVCVWCMRAYMRACVFACTYASIHTTSIYWFRVGSLTGIPDPEMLLLVTYIPKNSAHQLRRATA